MPQCTERRVGLGTVPVWIYSTGRATPRPPVRHVGTRRKEGTRSVRDLQRVRQHVRNGPVAAARSLRAAHELRATAAEASLPQVRQARRDTRCPEKVSDVREADVIVDTPPRHALTFRPSVLWGTTCPRQGSSLPPNRSEQDRPDLLPACIRADIRHRRKQGYAQAHCEEQSRYPAKASQTLAR